MDLLYVAGPPCAGKSTLMAALTAGCDRVPADTPVPHSRLVDPATGAVVGAELGRDRPGFPGTDALAMGVSPIACLWVRRGGPALLLAEGDRLAHMGFLESAAGGGYTVVLAVLAGPTAVLDERCGVRGTTQTEAWRRGRATKTTRLAERADAAGLAVTHLDATAPLTTLVGQLRAAVPALHALPAAGLS